MPGERTTGIRNAGSSLPVYQPMLLLLLFFAGGILFDRCFDGSVLLYGVGAALGLCGWGLLYSKRRTNHSALSNPNWEAILSLLLMLSMFCIGAFWFHARWNWFGENDISQFVGTEATQVCVEARVESEPRWMVAEKATDEINALPTRDRTQVALDVLRIRDGKDWIETSGRLDLIIHAKTEHTSAGDVVRVFGKLAPITGPTNPGQFDFREYFRARSQMASLHAVFPEAVVVQEKAKTWSGLRVLSSLRKELNRLTWKYVEPERAGLASAVLLGNRSQLTSSRRSQFLMTGTVHLLAISGLHVGILAAVFFFLYRIGLIGRKSFLWSTILFVLFYAWLVEFRPPVTRASILIVMLCVGRLYGFTSFSFNWLAFAGFIILLLSPADLFQIGPQLSFLAVATITFGKDWIFWPPPSDPLKKLIAYTRPFHVRTIYWMGRKSRAAILVSALIWLVAMPLVAFRFHLLAPIALIVNPILLIPIALALYGGLGVLVVGWGTTWAGKLFGWICNGSLAFIESTVGVANGVPASHYWTAGPSGEAVVVFYLGVFVLAVYPATRVPVKWFLSFVVAWTVLGWWVPNAISQQVKGADDSSLVCTFIDVGHGTSVLLELPDGRNLLYDAGSFGSANYAARNVSSLLWDRGIEHVDAIVLSHADVDHFNAMPQLCGKFSIGVVYLSEDMMKTESRAVTRLNEALIQEGVRLETIAAGDQLVADTTNIKVLGPPSFGTGGSDNSNSVVLLLDYLGKRILLPGDLEGVGMQILLAKEPVDVDVLMAPHHGSLHSSPGQLAAWCRPEWVVISGAGNRINDEVEGVFKRAGAEVFRTDVHGAVRVELGEQVFVEPFLSSSNPNSNDD